MLEEIFPIRGVDCGAGYSRWLRLGRGKRWDGTVDRFEASRGSMLCVYCVLVSVCVCRVGPWGFVSKSSSVIAPPCT